MADAVLVGAGTGAASGAAMGSMIGPWGTVVGGVVGGVAGAVGGMGQQGAEKSQKKALKAQQRAIEAEMRRRNQAVGLTREKFGDISQFGQGLGSKFQDIGKTLTARSGIQNQIDESAAAVRDAGRQELTDSTQSLAARVRQSSMARGLMGSSIDEGSRKMLLGSYAGARSNLGGAVEGTRNAGWQGIRNQQAGFEAAAQGGQSINGQLQALSTAGQISAARGQMAPALFGNLINTGIGVLDSGARSEAQGGRGLSAFGLPKLGLATPRAKTTGGM